MAYPGIHQNFGIDDYSADERKIIQRFSNEWFISSSTRPIVLLNKSVYRAFIARPCEAQVEAFNLEREIIFLFSSYDEFEVRTLDGYEEASSRWATLRTDPICKVLISKDRNIVERIKNILKNDPELPIVIPFTYEELLNNKDANLISNRFRQTFFSRDLFAFESPLKRDTYFFGRTDLINSLISRHKSNENSALFGLRRSGKTSIVFGLERAAKINKINFISIDCQSPSVHQRKWNELLQYLINKIIEKYNLKKKDFENSVYSEIDAADSFYDDINKIYKILSKNSILIAFDEIERITPRTASSSHWREKQDFVLFWQTVRSAFQRHTGVFSFCLIGTNSQCIEIPFINDEDNPIFNSVPISYIGGFNIEQTKEMVNKLGNYMGLKFDDMVISKMQEDFGGHPYLIRHVCSIVNKNAPSKRPCNIDKHLYEKAKREFVETYSNYTEMILDVLVKNFPDEYVMLTALATDNIEMFDTFSSDSNLTNHLIGYGLIEKGIQGYYFKIESIRDHLRKKERFKVNVTRNEDRMLEIGTRRIVLEPALRRLVSTIIRAKYGLKSKEEVSVYLTGQSLKRLNELGFTEAFAANSIAINLSELGKIISEKWDLFSNMFTLKKSEFEFYIEAIRKVRTLEAHSGKIGDDEFALCRIAFQKVEDDMRSAGFLGDFHK